jgi:hypothetical protein
LRVIAVAICRKGAEIWTKQTDLQQAHQCSLAIRVNLASINYDLASILNWCRFFPSLNTCTTTDTLLSGSS